MKKKLIISIAVCLGLLITGCGNSTAKKSLEEGKIALASNEYDKAEKLFKLAYDSDGNNEEASQYYTLISEYNKAVEYAEAEEYDKSNEKLKEVQSNSRYDSIKKDAEKLQADNKAAEKAEESEQQKVNKNESGNNVVSHKENTATDADYRSYTNGRFGYSIQYPGNMSIVSEADNGDGATLESADKSASLIVYGRNNINEDTAESVYNEELSGFEKEPEYKQLLKDSFVISWLENGVINYECCVVGNGSMNTFVLKYPASQKSDYESVTEKIYSSFKSPGVSEAH